MSCCGDCEATGWVCSAGGGWALGQPSWAKRAAAASAAGASLLLHLPLTAAARIGAAAVEPLAVAVEAAVVAVAAAVGAVVVAAVIVVVEVVAAVAVVWTLDTVAVAVAA